MKFLRYQHVERLGTGATEGIEIGTCYISGKIDGSNGQIFVDNGEIKAGSRNRLLTLENDNQGFYKTVLEQENLRDFFNDYPNLRLYAEFLIPHSLKTYRKDAWRKFYVFDVMDDSNKYLTYEQYQPIMEKYGIEYIPPIRIIKNGNVEVFTKILEENKYLIEDGMGTGEGIIIRNFDFVNKYGRVNWAKIVTSEFKEKHIKEMGAPVVNVVSVESQIVDKYVTEAFIRKEHAKIINNSDGWESRMIPQLLSTVFHELILEETWNFIKHFKNPRVDFKLLSRLATVKIKETMGELF